MFNHPLTARWAKIACKCLAFICSILACRTVSAEQTFVPTFVGDWLVEETHDVAPYMRQSGRDGLASVLLAPLDLDVYKNSFFSISCLNNRVYLNVNIPLKLTPGGEDVYDVTATLDGFVFSSNESKVNVYRHSYIEHGMLKAEIGEDFLTSFKKKSPTYISLMTQIGNVNFIYNNKEREHAVDVFLKSATGTKYLNRIQTKQSYGQFLEFHDVWPFGH